MVVSSTDAGSPSVVRLISSALDAVDPELVLVVSNKADAALGCSADNCAFSEDSSGFDPDRAPPGYLTLLDQLDSCALDLGYEHVPCCALVPRFTALSRDKAGVARVYEALSNVMWKAARMHVHAQAISGPSAVHAGSFASAPLTPTATASSAAAAAASVPTVATTSDQSACSVRGIGSSVVVASAGASASSSASAPLGASGAGVAAASPEDRLENAMGALLRGGGSDDGDEPDQLAGVTRLMEEVRCGWAHEPHSELRL